ncbi:hypothetical protein DPMN_080727, partial [Dreissena polymorpha]
KAALSSHGVCNNVFDPRFWHDEFLVCVDSQEAQDCVKEISEVNHGHFVSSAMNHVLERSSQSRKLTGFLLHWLVKQQIISMDSYISGLLEVLEFAEDLENDIPKIWQYYGEMISPMIQDSSVPLSFLKTAVGPLSQTNKAGVLLAEILHDASHREAMTYSAYINMGSEVDVAVTSLLRNSPLSPPLKPCSVLRVSDAYYPGGDSAPSTPTTGLPILQISERLHELIPKDLSARSDLLQAYLDHQPEFELEAMYALQELITHLEHPQEHPQGTNGYEWSLISHFSNTHKNTHRNTHRVCTIASRYPQNTHRLCTIASRTPTGYALVPNITTCSW